MSSRVRRCVHWPLVLLTLSGCVPDVERHRAAAGAAGAVEIGGSVWAAGRAGSPSAGESQGGSAASGRANLSGSGPSAAGSSGHEATGGGPRAGTDGRSQGGNAESGRAGLSGSGPSVGGSSGSQATGGMPVAGTDGTSQGGSAESGGTGPSASGASVGGASANEGTGGEPSAGEGGRKVASVAAAGAGAGGAAAGQATRAAASGQAGDGSGQETGVETAGAGGAGPESCEARSASDRDAVFVDQISGSDSADCGAIAQPCATVQQGIVRAAGIKPNVYVAAGTYVESVELIRGIRVEGAWEIVEGSWRPLCGAGADTAVTVQAPPDQDKTVVASDLEGSATLAQLAVLSKATADWGESLYGVFAVGESTKLTLDHVEVAVAAAGDGQQPPTPVDRLDGSPDGCSPGNGTNGPAQTGHGSGASRGTFTEDGYHPGNGLDGPAGNPGQNGAAPDRGGECYTECGQCPSASSSTCAALSNACGTDGKAGCAGGAGAGGGGGRGGGSSIALYVWDASVEVIGGSLEAGDAGHGSEGGDPGAGGLGVPGVPGVDATCNGGCSISSRLEGCYTVFSCATAGTGIGRGGPRGGTGGDGSSGGRGGGGAGGFSYAVYASGDASLRLTDIDSDDLRYGAAGVSLGGNGAPGKSGSQNG
jgi:hypothetical protein